MAKSKKVSKKRIVVIEPVGQAHINATFNNIIVTLTKDRRFRGRAPVKWASRDRRRTRLTPLLRRLLIAAK